MIKKKENLGEKKDTHSCLRISLWGLCTLESHQSNICACMGVLSRPGSGQSGLMMILVPGEALSECQWESRLSPAAPSLLSLGDSMVGWLRLQVIFSPNF